MDSTYGTFLPGSTNPFQMPNIQGSRLFGKKSELAFIIKDIQVTVADVSVCCFRNVAFIDRVPDFGLLSPLKCVLWVTAAVTSAEAGWWFPFVCRSPCHRLPVQLRLLGLLCANPFVGWLLLDALWETPWSSPFSVSSTDCSLVKLYGQLSIHAIDILVYFIPQRMNLSSSGFFFCLSWNPSLEGCLHHSTLALYWARFTFCIYCNYNSEKILAELVT